MEFLLSHWHCVLPVAAIIVAGIFMRDKPKDNDKKIEKQPDRLSVKYDEK